MMVQQLLKTASALHPEATAVVHGDKHMSFLELESASDALAAFLQTTWCVKRGHHICLLYENCPEYIVCYFAVLKTGATVVSLNSAEVPEKLSESIKHSDSMFCLGSRLLWRRLIAKVGIPETLIHGMDYRDSVVFLRDGKSEEAVISIAAGEHPENPGGIDLDLAEIVYTSGSTSKPKGVMLTHLNLTTNMVSIQDYFQLTSDDSIVVILPLSYIYGKSLLLTHIQVGAKIILDNRFTYPSLVLETLVKEKATGFAGVPSTYSLLTAKTAIAETELPHLRYVAQAGGAMAPALQKQVIEAVAPARLFVMYGATEAAPRLTWLPPEMIEEKIGSIGIPLLNVEMAIRGSDGALLPSGEEGELIARGSNIMKGYWKDPENTQRVLQDGYYLTGDIGYRDKDGYYFITGRKSDFIKVKGFRISCKEVEESLLELEEVQEAAVIGVPDSITGEAIMAYIVPSSLDTEDFWSHASKHIGRGIGANKVPQIWDFRDELPKNSSGKIMKEILKMEMK